MVLHALPKPKKTRSTLWGGDNAKNTPGFSRGHGINFRRLTQVVLIVPNFALRSENFASLRAGSECLPQPADVACVTFKT